MASRVCDVVDARRRLGGLPGRGEEGLGTEPVGLALGQTRRHLRPGAGAGKEGRHHEVKVPLVPDMYFQIHLPEAEMSS